VSDGRDAVHLDVKSAGPLPHVNEDMGWRNPEPRPSVGKDVGQDPLGDHPAPGTRMVVCDWYVLRTSLAAPMLQGTADPGEPTETDRPSFLVEHREPDGVEEVERYAGRGSTGCGQQGFGGGQPSYLSAVRAFARGC